MGIDFLLSYMLILKTSLSILSNDCHLKTLNTCISHLSAVALFFTPMICFSIPIWPKTFSNIFVLMANMHFLIPPVMNHIVYEVKLKHIQDKILKLFIKKRPEESWAKFITWILEKIYE